MREGHEDVDPIPAEKPAKKLLCVKEAVMPGRGHFKPGDIVTDADLIAVIGENHPFFTSAEPPAEPSAEPPTEAQPPTEEEPKEEGN